MVKNMGKKEYTRLAELLMFSQTTTPTKNPKYFEADVQLRNPSEELIRFIINQINSTKDVFVSVVVPIKQGIDFKISSQRFARALGKKLKKSFKGELKTTRSLFTRNRQTSKDVYRVTVFFRMDSGSGAPSDTD